MSLYHTDKHCTFYHGDCLQVLAGSVFGNARERQEYLAKLKRLGLGVGE